MMMSSWGSNRAPAFYSIATETKFRVLLGADSRYSMRPRLEQVTTAPGSPSDADALIGALNQAAWSGDMTPLESLLGRLPEPVRQSCLEAVARCRRDGVGPIGNDGLPMTTLREVFFTDASDASEAVGSAANLGLLAMVVNQINGNKIEYAVSILSDEVEVASFEEASDWAAGDSARRALSTQFCNEEEFTARIAAERWRTYASRGYWVWVGDGENESATMHFVVQTFDEAVDEANEMLRFCRIAVGEDHGPITERNRFMLWIGLHNLTADLGGLTDESDIEYSVFRDLLPQLAQNEPFPWWEKMYQSAERLTEAARTGDLAALVPRTPAEEALVYLATRPNNVGWSTDTIEMYDLQFVLDSLPIDGEWDGLLDEVLPELTGDVDIEMLWHPELDGIEDPGSVENQMLRLGDYRPAAWHERFRAEEPMD